MAKKISKKKIVFGAISVIVLIGLAVGGYFYFTNSQNPYKHLRSEKGKDKTGLEVLDQERYKADTFIQNGDLTAAKKIYDSRVADAAGDKNKSAAGVDAASAFFNIGQASKDSRAKALDYALAYATQAENVAPSASSAAILTQIYGALGDDAQASSYAAKLNERVEKHNDQKPSER